MKDILYDWGGFNVWLFHAINNVRGEPLDTLMLWGTTLGDHVRFPLYLATLTVCALWFATERGGRSLAAVRPRLWLEVLAVFSVAYLVDGWLVSWLKTTVDYPRLSLALPIESLRLVGKPELNHSLPSGHSLFAVTVVASLWPLFRRTGHALLAAFVLWVGLSRISLGVHFPADVLAGYLLGLGVVIVIRLAILRMFPAEHGGV